MNDIIKEVAEELGIPFSKAKKVIYSQYSHYKEVIRENNGETCRAYHLGKWKNVYKDKKKKE